MKYGLVQVHKGFALFIGIGTWVQLFLAGVWHAEVVSTPMAHVIFGMTLLLASLLALLAAVIGQLPRPVIKKTATLFILILLQPILMQQRETGLALLSALHTLNAAFIGMTAGIVVAMARSASPAPEVTEPAFAAGD